MKEKSSINLTSLVEFEHHLMADTIRNENEEKRIKVKAPVTAKTELKFLLCVDLVQILILRHIA